MMNDQLRPRHLRSKTIFAAALFGAAFCFAAWAVCEEPKNKDSEKPADEVKRVSVAVARDRAKLMHNVYSATLEVMHRHYFHENKAVLPARAMEDVFADVGYESNMKSRWIAVNTKAMSIHHEPKNDFERKAAAEIATGKEEYERIEDGYYHRAGVIHLTSGCVTCHTGFLTSPPKTPRYAGLVISIPVDTKSESK